MPPKAWRGWKPLAKRLPVIGIGYTIYDLYQQWPGGDPVPEGWDMTGWEETFSCGRTDNVLYRTATTTCGERVVGSYGDPAIYENQSSVGRSTISFYDTSTFRKVGSFVYGAPSSQWTRISDSSPEPTFSEAQPGRAPQWRTVPEPLIPSWVDPFSSPIGEPEGTPQPPPHKAIPRRTTNPYRSVHEQTQVGPKGQIGPGWEIAVRPEPPTQPGPTITIPNVGPPVVVPNPPQPPREPPPKGEKEKKVIVRIGGVAMKILNVATESLDFVNALYDALPKQYRPGYYKLHYRDKKTGEIKTYYKRRWRASQWQRSKAVYQHFDKIPLGDALGSLAKNQLEDMFYGRLSQLGVKARQQAGEAGPAGRSWEFGPWDTGFWG